MEKTLADAVEMAEKKAEKGKTQEKVEKKLIDYIFMRTTLFKKKNKRYF